MSWNFSFNSPFFTTSRTDLFQARNPRFRFAQENDPFYYFGTTSAGRIPQNVNSPRIEALDEEDEPQLMRGRLRGQVPTQPIEINDEEEAHSHPTNEEDKELNEAIRRSLEEKKREKQRQAKPSKPTIKPTSSTQRSSDSYTVQEVEEENDTASTEMYHNMDIDEEEQIQKVLKQSAELHKYEQERKRFEQERILREQQEREYAESLKMDQEKEKLRLEKESLEMEKKKKEQEMKEHEESAELLAAMQLSEDLSVKTKLMKQLKTEPARTEQNITQIIYRLPNGDKIQRRFYQNEKVEVLFKFLESRTEEQVPKNFELVINYPRKVFSKTEKTGLNITLSEAQLVPQAVLFVKELVQ